MKIYSSFTNQIHDALKGNFKTIAVRYDVSNRYVALISNNKREIQSPKSILIFMDLIKLIKVLQPEMYQSYFQDVPQSIINIIKKHDIEVYEDYLIFKTNQ